MIPAFAPKWTNHNESDPGITLIELFAYITEMLLYRTNRIGDTHLHRFLQLIRGPARKFSAKHVQAEIRDTVLSLQKIRRAVTARDYEELVLSANDKLRLSTSEQVSRVKCIPRRNLRNSGPAAQTTDAPGSVSVVIVPNRRAPATTELLRAVRNALEPARLLTARIHVVGARYVTFSLRIKLVVRPGVPDDTVKEEAISSLETFFDPWKGGRDKKGWPFGKNIYVSEIYQLLDDVSGVDYVTRRKNPSTGDDLIELAVAPAETHRLRWNHARELEAVELRADELPIIWIDANDIEVSEAR